MKSEVKRLVGQYVRIECPCGSHLIDFFGAAWNDKKTGFYTCNSCERPLVCKGEDDKFYYVGKEITF